jgi:hypothetical protein
VSTWIKKEPKEKGLALEESRAEAGRNQEKIGVVPKR